MEIELAWSNHDTGNFDRLSPDGTAERHYLSELLAATETTEIPISFDVVGHLVLESCSGRHESPHPADWFQADPGTDYRTDGLFYAPDAIDGIASSSVDHEICTHTFSHALFDEMTHDACVWELETVQDLHREHFGRPTRSLVPPRHQLPPYDVLGEHGIEVVRPPMQSQSRSKPRRFKQLLAGPLPLSDLRVSDGLVETSCTTYPSLTAPALPSGQGSTHPAFRWIPAAVRHRYHLDKLIEATERATDKGAHLHLWCHLFDLSNAGQFRVVEEYLTWLDSYRRDHDVRVVTMEELPRYVENAAYAGRRRA